MLVLTVGEVPSNAWTGLGGDGRMSTGANWSSGSVPSDGSDLDFSSVVSDVAIIADSGSSFGAVTMGGGVITFLDSLTATSFSDTAKVAVGTNSVVTIDGDLVYSGSSYETICYSVASGGVFRVTGDIVASKDKAGHTNYLLPSITPSIDGTIAAKGLVNDIMSTHNENKTAFALVKNGGRANWEIGEDGLSGNGVNSFFTPASDGSSAKITATADFSCSAVVANHQSLELDTGVFTITLGSGGESLGGIAFSGTTTISGSGKVVANYDIENQTSDAEGWNQSFDVRGSATLAIVPGSQITKSGTVTVATNATLLVAQSGTVAPGGSLVLENGAALGFNFSDRRTSPMLAIPAGSTIPDVVDVKIGASDGVQPASGMVCQLTSGFDFTGKVVNLVDRPDWLKEVSVDADGNIVATIKSSGFILIVH